MSAIDAYLATIDSVQKDALERVRRIIHAAAPDAIEVISYGMPGFQQAGHYLIGFAAFKDHLSLFPTSQPIEVMKAQLSAYKLAKGTIQFTLDMPVPEALIKEIVALRLAAIAGR